MKPMFELTEAYDFGKEMARRLRESLKGRSVFSEHDAGLLAQVVYLGQHGNHVEIGALFGASAILAASVKKEFGMYGDVYSVDPLDNRDRPPMDKKSGLQATRELFMQNMEDWGVADRVHLVAKPSFPWPLAQRFSSAYIDGDHWGGMPSEDWISVSQNVSYIIMFDDYALGKPDVTAACLGAALHPDWIPVHVSGISFILRRRE